MTTFFVMHTGLEGQY